MSAEQSNMKSNGKSKKKCKAKKDKHIKEEMPEAPKSEKSMKEEETDKQSKGKMAEAPKSDKSMEEETVSVSLPKDLPVPDVMSEAHHRWSRMHPPFSSSA